MTARRHHSNLHSRRVREAQHPYPVPSVVVLRSLALFVELPFVHALALSSVPEAQRKGTASFHMPAAFVPSPGSAVAKIASLVGEQRKSLGHGNCDPPVPHITRPSDRPPYHLLTISLPPLYHLRTASIPHTDRIITVSSDSVQLKSIFPRS